jgi:type IX secretion system PorP/SprF family membrane protein
MNPAIAGSETNSLNFEAGKQWFGIHDSPFYAAFHINGRLAPFGFYKNDMLINKTKYRSIGRVGLGAAILTDRTGPFSFSEFKLIYSYHLPLNKNQLSFGLSNDFEIYGVHENIMDPLVPNDPAIQGLSRSKALYNPGIGIYYYGDLFSTGMSVNNIFGDRALLKNDYLTYSKKSSVFTIHGNYKFELHPEVDLEPGIMIGTSDFNDYIFDISGTAVYRRNYMLKITYRSLNILFFHIGVDLHRYGIAYGYNTPLSSINRYTSGSHQVAVSVKFGQYVY